MREICSSGTVRGGVGDVPTYSAERVSTDIELASIIADNHHLAQQPMRLDAAPQRPFGGDTDWIRRDLQRTDAEAVEMRLPGGLIGEPCLSMGGQPMDDGPCQGTATHIVQRCLIDDVVGVSGAQQIEEVQPALARPSAEPGEIVVADLLVWTAPDGIGCARMRSCL